MHQVERPYYADAMADAEADVYGSFEDKKGDQYLLTEFFPKDKRQPRALRWLTKFATAGGFLKQNEQVKTNPDREVFHLAIRNAKGKVIGYIRINFYEEPLTGEFEAEIDYRILKPYRRREIASRAVVNTAQFLKQIDCKLLILKIDSWNEASQNLAKNLGFERENPFSVLETHVAETERVAQHDFEADLAE